MALRFRFEARMSRVSTSGSRLVCTGRITIAVEAVAADSDTVSSWSDS